MRHYRLGLITWNVGGAPSGVVSGTSTLLHTANHCDVIVVGLQEVAVGRRGWKDELRKGLGPDWIYMGGESYAGLRVKVFARLSPEMPSVPVLHLSALNAHDASRVGQSVRKGMFPVVGINGQGKRLGVGVADRWPNKGAVAVEIQFAAACRVVFVVAHLAANEEKMQDREDDWRGILRRWDRDELSLARGTEPVISVPLFHRYEHVFVLGDLNYRIAPPGTDFKQRVEWVRELIKKGDWRKLVDADQLTQARAGDKIFANFQEGDITFAPTFKIDPRTGNYSMTRVPSYCDRILWHSLPARINLVKCEQYKPLTAFMKSDHIPVFGEFELKVPHIIPPPKPLDPVSGKRIVLEFMLVRFVKGASQFSKREAFDEGPPSMRHIREPASLNLPLCNDVNGSILGDVEAKNCLDPKDYEELVMEQREDEEEDILEEGDDDDSTSSSSGEEENNIQDRDNNSPVVQSSQLRLIGGASLEALDPEVCRSGTIAVGSLSNQQPNLELLSRHFRKSSAESSGDILLAQPNHSSTSIDSTGSLTAEMPTESSRQSERPLAHANSGPRKRDSLSRQVEDNNNDQKNKKASTRRRLNKMRMEVHGQGLFLKQSRIYRVSIPKRVNGLRERIGESLPVIPLMPITRLEDLDYRHVLIEFAKKSSRVGTSGALPLRELLRYVGKPYAFELSLTKYGFPVGMLEACVQLTVSDSLYWVDAKGRVVRNSDGSSSKNYRGELHVRKRTRAKSKAQNHVRI